MRFSVWFVLGQGMRLVGDREAEAAGAGWNHLLKNLAWLGLVLGLQGSPHSFGAREQNLFLPNRRHPEKKEIAGPASVLRAFSKCWRLTWHYIPVISAKPPMSEEDPECWRATYLGFALTPA